jgi:hypothetical protein
MVFVYILSGGRKGRRSSHPSTRCESLGGKKVRASVTVAFPYRNSVSSSKLVFIQLPICLSECWVLSISFIHRVL